MNSLTLGLCLASAGAFAAALLAPEKPAEACRAPFYGRNYAHRGLHTPDKSVPENSIPAFKRASELGYGVELDVRLTKDGAIVVFHDDDTLRLCGTGDKVEGLTLAALRELRLCSTEFGIPLLSEALEAVGPDCPVIVELKRGSRNAELCEKTYEIIRRFGGTCCIESFDPRIVAWFRHNAPELLRGQLSADPAELAKDTSCLNAFAVGNLLTNVLSRPHFIAYRIGRKPLSVRLCEKLGAMRVAWVADSPAAEETNDAVIFEFYTPVPKYK
jgi:glycerophosphoryl diester phosphodiesterase